jgi:hypothetical protein
MQGMGLFAVIRGDSKVAITVPHRDYINYVRLDRVDRRPKEKTNTPVYTDHFTRVPKKIGKNRNFRMGRT